MDWGDEPGSPLWGDIKPATAYSLEPSESSDSSDSTHEIEPLDSESEYSDSVAPSVASSVAPSVVSVPPETPSRKTRLWLFWLLALFMVGSTWFLLEQGQRWRECSERELNKTLEYALNGVLVNDAWVGTSELR